MQYSWEQKEWNPAIIQHNGLITYAHMMEKDGSIKHKHNDASTSDDISIWKWEASYTHQGPLYMTMGEATIQLISMS